MIYFGFQLVYVPFFFISLPNCDSSILKSVIDSASDLPQLEDKVEAEHHEPTATDYRSTIINASSGVITSGDCLVLNHMLRSSSSDVLADGLRLVSSLSVRTSAATKVCTKYTK